MENTEGQPPPLPLAETSAPSPPRWPATLVVMLCWLIAFIFPIGLAGIIVITSDEGEEFTLYDGYPLLFLSLIVIATVGMITTQILIAFRVIRFRLRSYFFVLIGYCVTSGILMFAAIGLLSPRTADRQFSPERLGELAGSITCPMITLGGIAWLVGIIVKWK